METEPASDARKGRYLVVCNDSDYFLRHRLPVVQRLVELGADVTVVTGGAPIGEDVAAGWSHVHVPIERFSFHVLRDPVLLLRTLVLARAVKPDAVHLITLKPAVFSGFAVILARRLFGRPHRILVTIPGLGRMMAPTGPDRSRAGGLARRLAGRSIRFLSSRRHVHFTFETRQDRQHWLQEGLIRKDGSSVISGAGVNPAQFHPSRDRAAREPITVLFASRLLRSKGLDAFIALARRFADRSDVRFLVAGMSEGNDPDCYAPSELEREESIEFIGGIKDMAPLLRSVDLVCLPTRYGEGIPRILIEAAASGVACLATDLGGCREIVKDGQTGFLVPTGSGLVEALAKALTRYLDDPPMLMRHGEAGHRLFAAHAFDQKTVVERFIALLTGEAKDLQASRG